MSSADELRANARSSCHLHGVSDGPEDGHETCCICEHEVPLCSSLPAELVQQHFTAWRLHDWTAAREELAYVLEHGHRRPFPWHREPYVGSGADGARRSAAIDRSEADTLPTGPHQPGWEQLGSQRAVLLASAERWEQQAQELSSV